MTVAVLLPDVYLMEPGSLFILSWSQGKESTLAQKKYEFGSIFLCKCFYSWPVDF